MEYKKGDIVIIEFPFSDFSSKKKRPALIVSNERVNKTGDFLMVQITSKLREDDLSIRIHNTNYTKNKALPLESCIRLHKIFSLNKNLIIRKETSLKQIFLREVTNRISGLIN